MSDFKYVIIGGGMTADSAVSGIREHDGSGAIAVFTEEKDMPYNRPPLSKGLWKGDQLDSIWRNTGKQKVDFFAGTRIKSIDRSLKSVTAGDGKSYTYEKLLLATGGTPRKLPSVGEGVIYYRTVEDYRKLRAVVDTASDFVVVGGGFIGSEVAAALAMNGKNVTLIFPDNGIGARVYPKGLSAFLINYFSEKGVKVHAGESVVSIGKSDSGYAVETKSGKKFAADAVVAGVGIMPNDALAKASGLAVDNGIIVDAFLRTTDHAIYSAGDVANFYNRSLDIRMRVEHEDNANTMGKLAGLNMSGDPEPYNHLPFFYSDLFDLGYEAVGDLNAGVEVVEDWVEEYRKGVVYYLNENRVTGVLLWNTWGKLDDARKLIDAKKKHTAGSLKRLISD